MTIYLLAAFLLSLICGWVTTPLILDFCKRKKLYDIPNERKVHKNATPRLGGISFFPSMLLAFLCIIMYIPLTNQYNLSVNIWSAVYLIGLLIIYLTGILDDLTGLNAPTKFFMQVTTACLLPFCGLYINNLYGLFGIHEVPYYIGIPLTVFIMVLIDNSINLIDGIDGLAASISLLALAGFLIYFRHYQVFVNTYSILAAGMMGALTAFLYFNLFGKLEKNTKIFMGDSGSLSLGFTLGFLFIKCASDNTAIWPTRQEALIAVLRLRRGLSLRAFLRVRLGAWISGGYGDLRGRAQAHGILRYSRNAQGSADHAGRGFSGGNVLPRLCRRGSHVILNEGRVTT